MYCFMSATGCHIFVLTQTNRVTQIHFYIYEYVYRKILTLNFELVDGSLLRLNEAWQLFDKKFLPIGSEPNMTCILTEMDHPVLFRPFLTLHPCRTAELLSALPERWAPASYYIYIWIYDNISLITGLDFTFSKNKVLSFLSAIGPSIHLKLGLGYAN